MGRHFHFLGQLQQGNIISVELRDALTLLCVDVKLWGNQRLLHEEFFAIRRGGIPWGQWWIRLDQKRPKTEVNW